MTGPSAWRPGQFSGTDDWTLVLSDDDRAALESIGRGDRECELVHPLVEKAQAWSRRLTKGTGFLRLRRFPVDLLDPVQAERAYLVLGRCLGTPTAQDRQGSLVTHIRDEQLPNGPGVRRYQTNLSQPFHSDAADIVALLCVQSARSGGTSRIVSAHSIFNEMADQAPELLDILYEPMPWSRHTEERPGEKAYFELAPMSDVNGLPRVSVIPWFIRQSQNHPTAPRLTEKQLAALDLFESIANNPTLQITMEFEPGDVQVLNNTSILHARDAYEDHDGPELRRHLIRLWLTADEPVADDVMRGFDS